MDYISKIKKTDTQGVAEWEKEIIPYYMVDGDHHLLEVPALASDSYVAIQNNNLAIPNLTGLGGASQCVLILKKTSSGCSWIWVNL